MERKGISVEAQGEVLKAFSRALQREAHVLTQRPDLLWQQMYNRLQFEEGGVAQVITLELQRHRTPGTRPWIHLKTPYRESRALISTLPSGLTDGLEACAVSPDGRLVASISGDQTLCLWEVATRQLCWTLKDQSGHIKSIAFSPDGEQLYLSLLTYDDHKFHIKVVDANTGTFLSYLNIKLEDWFAFGLSSDCRLLVTSGLNIKLYQWLISSGQRLLPEKTAPAYVVTLAISPNGRTIVYASSRESNDYALRVWDIIDNHPVFILIGHTNVVRSCAFSPDGRFIASTGEDNTLGVWDVATGHQLWRHGNITNPRWCAVSPDGRYVASTYRGYALRVWGILTGEPVCTLEGHTETVTSGAFLPDGDHIISASDDNTLRLWEIITIHNQPKEFEEMGKIKTCAYSPDGRFVTFLVDSGDFPDHSVHHLDASTGESFRGFYRKAASNYESCVAYAFSPNRQLIVSSSGDKTLQVWEAASEQTLHTLAGHTERVTTCAFSPDGRLIISGSWDCTPRLWEAATGRLRRTLPGHQGWINDCAFSPDGNLILSASRDKSLRIWDTTSGKTVRILKGHLEGVNSCVFSPDGQWILSASEDNTLRLWHTGTGSLLRTLEGHTSHVTACAFSPDGTLLASASLDKTLRIWSANSGQEISRLPLPGALLTLGFHPFRPDMVCGGAGGVLYRLEFIGYNYEAIIVTTLMKLAEYEVLCPACQQKSIIGKCQFGSHITCSTSGCGLQLQINPSNDQFRKDKKHWLSRLIKT